MNNIIFTINVLMLIATFIFICCSIWAIITHYNLKSEYALLVCYVILFILCIIKLILKIIVNENITDTIFYVIIFAIVSYNQMQSINSKKGK